MEGASTTQAVLVTIKTDDQSNGKIARLWNRHPGRPTKTFRGHDVIVAPPVVLIPGHNILSIAARHHANGGVGYTSPRRVANFPFIPNLAARRQ